VKTIRCILKEGKEKPLEGFHPWIFSGAIDEIDESFKVGDLVKVFSANGRYLGTGYLNPRSQIAVRMLTFDEVEINEWVFTPVDGSIYVNSIFPCKSKNNSGFLDESSPL
jgi:23S rRNA (cytosine1962-C5)-methyltransferase